MGSHDRKWAERFFANVSWGLGVLHLALSILYFEAGVLLMVLVNLVCLPVSGACIRLVRKECFRAYTLTLFISELIQLTVSAFCVGWVSGFLIPLIGLAAFVFLIEYLSHSIGIPFIPALPLGITDFAVFVLLFLLRFRKPGLLSVPESIVKIVEILWSIPVFAAIVIGLYSLIRMTSDSERALSNKAQTDRLTGLYNRAGYDRLCSEADLNTTTLLIVDTDKFKGINDRFGHETGDRVLRKIAAELETSFRRQDRVCRIGGDEFAVLMADTDKLEEDLITARIERINRELSRPSAYKLPGVSVSVGVAHGSDAEDWTELFKHADEVLYLVKKDGGNGLNFYRP